MEKTLNDSRAREYWTDEENAYLAAHWQKQSDTELATALCRSRSSVVQKRHALSLKRCERLHGPNWSQEEIDYLCDNWGQVSMKRIAQKLGRPIGAIINQQGRLGLGAFLDAGGYVSFNQLCLALGRGGGSTYMATSWIKKRGFPVKYKTVRNCKFAAVYLDDFWEWAERNRTFIDFSKMEPLALGKEPAWVEEQRRHDFRCRRLRKMTPWSKAEDERLARLLRGRRHGYLALSKELRRSTGAIHHRILDLGIPERPIKTRPTAANRWTREEYRELGELIKRGCSYPEMADILGRSEKALRGRCFDVYRTERLDEVAAMMGGGEWGDNAPEQTMSMLRRQKEREAKRRAELMCALLDLLKTRRSELSFDGYWQKDMCMNWHKVKGCLAGAENCDVCGSNFRRIPPQYCVRCGGTFHEREKNNLCGPCRKARIKQAQRKWAVTHKSA